MTILNGADNTIQSSDDFHSTGICRFCLADSYNIVNCKEIEQAARITFSNFRKTPLIQFDIFNRHSWRRQATYIPKYCPECGRKLING